MPKISKHISFAWLRIKSVKTYSTGTDLYWWRDFTTPPPPPKKKKKKKKISKHISFAWLRISHDFFGFCVIYENLPIPQEQTCSGRGISQPPKKISKHISFAWLRISHDFFGFCVICENLPIPQEQTCTGGGILQPPPPPSPMHLWFKVHFGGYKTPPSYLAGMRQEIIEKRGR